MCSTGLGTHPVPCQRVLPGLSTSRSFSFTAEIPIATSAQRLQASRSGGARLLSPNTWAGVQMRAPTRQSTRLGVSLSSFSTWIVSRSFCRPSSLSIKYPLHCAECSFFPYNVPHPLPQELNDKRSLDRKSGV